MFYKLKINVYLLTINYKFPRSQVSIHHIRSPKSKEIMNKPAGNANIPTMNESEQLIKITAMMIRIIPPNNLSLLTLK